ESGGTDADEPEAGGYPPQPSEPGGRGPEADETGGADRVGSAGADLVGSAGPDLVGSAGSPPSRTPPSGTSRAPTTFETWPGAPCWGWWCGGAPGRPPCVGGGPPCTGGPAGPGCAPGPGRSTIARAIWPANPFNDCGNTSAIADGIRRPERATMLRWMSRIVS